MMTLHATLFTPLTFIALAIFGGITSGYPIIVGLLFSILYLVARLLLVGKVIGKFRYQKPNQTKYFFTIILMIGHVSVFFFFWNFILNRNVEMHYLDIQLHNSYCVDIHTIPHFTNYCYHGLLNATVLERKLDYWS